MAYLHFNLPFISMVEILRTCMQFSAHMACCVRDLTNFSLWAC
uniref:Uncharacterized protein n=1 Tax=Arundo donax TaxID=35708 RepID=A0A0A8YXA0_ARUDO